MTAYDSTGRESIRPRLVSQPYDSAFNAVSESRRIFPLRVATDDRYDLGYDIGYAKGFSEGLAKGEHKKAEGMQVGVPIGLGIAVVLFYVLTAIQAVVG